jgi:hypothetical protein
LGLLERYNLNRWMAVGGRRRLLCWVPWKEPTSITG